jgi:hypothetical protein
LNNVVNVSLLPHTIPPGKSFHQSAQPFTTEYRAIQANYC